MTWNEVIGATRYQVRDSKGVSFYDGILPEAFISGLPDGQHSFSVKAYSDDGGLVGASQTAAVITVDHWSMTQAWVCFGVGLVVVLAIIGAIGWGWMHDRQTSSCSLTYAKRAETYAKRAETYAKRAETYAKRADDS
ncbi:hypothetical protein [Rubripirellula reticaptiva]|uniref:hypothetical protein n=1 Tax=Rubripirellula reticaptiva TaxID=2528013 RepID=UPI0011B6FA60|nr:hypothetical protein [Rubripirellula reticaptiva]